MTGESSVRAESSGRNRRCLAAAARVGERSRVRREVQRARRASLLGLVPLLAALVTFSGCGKKGDPQPPIRMIPAPTTDLAAVQRDGDVLLDFGYPQATAAGTPLGSLSEVAVWELVWRVPAGAPVPTTADSRQFLAGARPVVVLDHDELAAAIDGDRVRLTVPVPPPPPPSPAASAVPGVVTAAPAAPAEPAATEPAPAPAPAEPAPREGATPAPPAAPEEGGTPAGTPAPAPGETPAPAAAPAPAPELAPPGGLAMVALAIKTQGPSGEESALSNLIAYPIQTAPAPATGLGVEGGAGGVKVSWQYPLSETPSTEPETPAAPEPGDGAETPALEPGPAAETPAAVPAAEAGATAPATEATAASGEVSGFDVYRRQATERTYGKPLRFVGPRSRSFLDESAVFGQRYIYTVTAVSERQPVLVESTFAEEVEIEYVDRYPPPPPEGLVALYGEGRVRLVWKASQAPDLAGYRVYRRSPDTQEFRPLTKELLSATELVDRDLAPGASYTYRVTAVDRKGNESKPSETAKAQVRARG